MDRHELVDVTGQVKQDGRHVGAQFESSFWHQVGGVSVLGIQWVLQKLSASRTVRLASLNEFLPSSKWLTHSVETSLI